MNILKLNELYMYEVAKLMHKHTWKKLSTNLSSFSLQLQCYFFGFNWLQFIPSTM